MGKESTPAPTQYYQPAQPTQGESMESYLKTIPMQLEMQQKYGDQFNQLDYEALQKYSPLINDLMASEQARLSPNQYALNESLAGQALTGSTAQLPKLMQDAYTQNLRSEIDPNIGSPIGADYVSRNLAQLGEQYRQNYQNLGLSMLNKYNTTAQTPNLASPAKSDYSLNNSMSNQLGQYQAYNNAMANSFYQPAPKSGMNWGGLLGGAASLGGSMYGAGATNNLASSNNNMASAYRGF